MPDQPVGGVDDVPGGPVIFNEVHHLRRVVLLELTDEFHVGAPEGVNVLIVVADRHDRQPSVAVLKGAAGDGRYEVVLRLVDVLVLVHQDVAVAPQELVPHIVGLDPRHIDFTL